MPKGDKPMWHSDNNATNVKPGELALKPYYRIGEIVNWLQVDDHVLRYWQTEFGEALGGVERRGTGKQRVYSRRQAVVLGSIKELLYTELYTIAGAKRQLKLAAERLKAG